MTSTPFVCSSERATESAAATAPRFSRRSRLSLWTQKRDTVMFEAFLGLEALVVAWRAVEQFDGRPAAPFIASLLLQWSGQVWMTLLVVNGLCTLGALIYGQLTGNTFQVRSIFSLVGSCIWSAVAIGTLSAPAPYSAFVGYALLTFFSWGVAVVLGHKADLARRAEKKVASPHELPPEGATEERLAEEPLEAPSPKGDGCGS